MTDGRVRIRCTCRKVLREVRMSLDTDPQTAINVPNCRACNLPSPARIVDVLMRTPGKHGIPIGGEVTVGDLQEPLLRSVRRGGRWEDWTVRIVRVVDED